MKIKTNFICAILAVFLGCLLGSCKKTESNPELTHETSLITSAEQYATLMEKRSDGPGRFTIQDIKRNGDILTIRVQGGCEEEDFNIVWDGAIAFSYPGQVNLVLNNTSESDCGFENQFDIEVKLSKVIGKHDPKDLMFNVANGSVKEDKSLNPNGSVSSR